MTEKKKSQQGDVSDTYDGPIPYLMDEDFWYNDPTPLYLEMKHIGFPDINLAIRRARKFLNHEVPWLTERDKINLTAKMETDFREKSANWKKGALAKVICDFMEVELRVIVCTQDGNCKCDDCNESEEEDS